MSHRCEIYLMNSAFTTIFISILICQTAYFSGATLLDNDRNGSVGSTMSLFMLNECNYKINRLFECSNPLVTNY